MNPNPSLQDACDAHDGRKRTLYVFVRTDIELHHQLVQLGHAAAEAARKYYRPEHGVASLIALAVPDQRRLYAAQRELETLGLEHAMFFEPDFGIGDSALGTRPLLDEERKLLKRWPLWRAPKFAAAREAA